MYSSDGTVTNVCHVDNARNSDATDDGDKECKNATPCPKGYYCEKGTDNAVITKKKCPKGKYCPGGRAALVCLAGTYQPSEQQEACLPCDAGSVCDGSTPERLTSSCKAGRYCPSGTKYDDEHPCPAGKYNPSTGSTSDAACLDCTKGYYC